MTKLGAQRFGRLLTHGVYEIRLIEDKNLQVVQDELGYALGRNGGSVIEYWRKGHFPTEPKDVAILAREIVRRGRVGSEWLQQFLESVGYPHAEELIAELFPSVPTAQGPYTVASRTLAPFVIGPPITHPRQFFGRTYELRRIFELWSRLPLQNVAVVGPKRSGKTSLLHYLRSITMADPADLRPGQFTEWLPQPEHYRWVMVDFQDARLRSQSRLLNYLLSQLGLPTPEGCDLACFTEIIGEELRQPAIILFDEIGAALKSPELDDYFWWGLRSLASNQTHGHLGFLLTAHQSPAALAQAQEKTSPFFNIFGYTCELGPLTEEEARELIASGPVTFSELDTEWILKQSGRWPYLVQILCLTRLSTLSDRERSPTWREEGLRQIAPVLHLLEKEV